MLRLPAELALRERRVEDASLQLAGPQLGELRLTLHTRDALDPLVQLDHRRLNGRPDVEHAAGMVRRSERRRDDIAHVHVVARLRPVAGS